MSLSYEYTLEDIGEAAAWILDQAGAHTIWAFHGPMGAGKTTLIREICAQMGVMDEVSSPTYGIVNEYLSDEGPVYHFDFYRLEDPMEAFDIGLDEYFDSGCICLLEWPENIGEILPPGILHLKLEVLEGDNRRISLTEA